MPPTKFAAAAAPPANAAPPVAMAAFPTLEVVPTAFSATLPKSPDIFVPIADMSPPFPLPDIPIPPLGVSGLGILLIAGS